MKSLFIRASLGRAVVAKVRSAARKTFDYAVRERQEVDGCAVDVKSLVIEGSHG